MRVDVIIKMSFAVIGKLGQGYSEKGVEWIPPLWKEANSNFAEISSLAKKDENENLVGFWGAMSDTDDSFNRWSEQGKYLAGCEVVDKATPPENWTKWMIPSYKYLVVKCTQETYAKIFNDMIEQYFPDNNHQLVGAVHEYYDPQESDGGLYLYFPIERL